jgi:TPR repeat protein
MYELGLGVEQDTALAMWLYVNAANKGSTLAQSTLGFFYEQGINVETNANEAMRWYRLAAEQGDSGAQFNLARYYELGMGVQQDYMTAYMWYSLANADGYYFGKDNADFLAENMTPAQISEAQQRAQACVTNDHKNC